MSDKIRLQHTTAKEAVERAKQEVITERKGEQLGLLTRFPEFNVASRKYLRFNNVNLLAGLSGSGKSYLWTMITEDFLDYGKGGINENINFIPVVLHFCFEMSSYNEILRAVSNDLGMGYNYILSSKYNKDTKSYNVLSDEELTLVENALAKYQNKSILYYETAGNMNHIYNTIEYVYNSFKDKEKEHKLIINIDHTLLIETIGNQEALELMADVGKYAVKIRKSFGAMVNLIGQLNNNIEDVRRLTNPALQYPQKSDIYAQGQLYNACDSVFVWHQPALLKLKEYGPKKYDTRGLLHLLILKARHGNIGSIWFLNQLDEGKIVPHPMTQHNPVTDEHLEDL
jgi:replicative DNA helicase